VRVFLCHRTESEGPLAVRLAEDLEATGIATWIAPRDVDPGVTWPQAVEAGLRASTHVAVLVTELALGSPEVREQLRIAEMLQLDGQVVVLPLLVERVEPPSWLHVAQGVDLTGSYPDAFSVLLRSLRRVPARDGERLILHRVRRGDRIDLLAARYLGEPALWRLIAEENPGLDVGALEPGTLVAIRARGR
jgi:hypothetical protein